MTQLFRIPSETAARFTFSQRQWMNTKCRDVASEGLEIDLDQLNMQELYNLDNILNWVEKYWKERNYHAEQPTSEITGSLGAGT